MIGRGEEWYDPLPWQTFELIDQLKQNLTEIILTYVGKNWNNHDSISPHISYSRCFRNIGPISKIW